MMRIVTVTRKPISGSTTANVVEHGTGALNIDACRIGSGTRPLRLSVDRGIERNTYEGGAATRGGSHAAGETSTGRWPANVLLQHRPGCQCLGTQTVKGNVRKPTGRAIYRTEGGAVVWNPNDVRDTTVRGSEQEEVSVWKCEPDCPVVEIDAQSGMSLSSGGRLANISKGQRIYGGGKGLGVDLAPEEVRGDPGYGDVGGASRYFKSVK